MPKQITTFEGFVRHIIKLILWVVLLTPLFILPIYYVLYTLMGRSFVDLFSMSTNPSALAAFMSQLMSTEPTKTLFQLTTFPGFTFAALFSTVFMVWVERKFIAKVQLRVGPQYAGRFEGILQNFADLFKLLFKEMLVPDQVDKGVYVAIPLALMFIAGSLLALVPLGPTTYIADPPVGAIFVFAIISFTPLVVMLAGWASNNKFSLLGSLRALHQMVAYEIPMILSALGVVVLSGTLDLVKIVGAQGSVWFIVLQPLGAMVFFTCTLAELERIPFDLPEADSELVAGWQTEYGGMNFGIFQLATYIKFYALAGVFTTLFLGGWQGPGFAPPEAWFLLKTFIVMLLMMLPRAVLPRVTIGSLLRGGWTKLMLLAFLNLLMALVVVSIGLYAAGGV
ncbi:MAG TPA: NADH-quinone oxidoreductase subunit NuoH [Nitrososphaerales archaeon]|nr:NADH-quinone oxidoreductase subunit NuoH [Nitrososphaerales archaeon]